MATQTPFDVPELFDAIMTDLDSTQLFVNLRVCRSWRLYLMRSKLLRGKMFLPAVPITFDPSRISLNPWLDRVIHSDTHELSAGWRRPDASWRKTLLFHPALACLILDVHIWFTSGARIAQIDSGRGPKLLGAGRCSSLRRCEVTPSMCIFSSARTRAWSIACRRPGPREA